MSILFATQVLPKNINRREEQTTKVVTGVLMVKLSMN